MALDPPPSTSPPEAITDIGTAVMVALVLSFVGGLAYFAGRSFIGEAVALWISVPLAGIGVAFVVRAWWIGPLCAHLDRVASLLERLDRQGGTLDRIARGVEEGNVLSDAARNAGSPPPHEG